MKKFRLSFPIRAALAAMLLLIVSFACGMGALAAPSGPPVTGTSLDNNPYVKWSPDYMAWTLGNSDTYGYENHLHAWNPAPGTMTTFYTGVTGTALTAPAGYHIYEKPPVFGQVFPISRWECHYCPSPCIQGVTYGFGPDHMSYWCGMLETEPHCERRHHNGWIGFCADCGRMATALTYASDAAIRSITSLPSGYGSFYICPYTIQYDAEGHPTNGHFEQGYVLSHNCDAISANRYTVKYNANFPTGSIPGYNGAGYTASTMHSYDNNMYYNGTRGEYATALRKNNYEYVGYKFIGWSTQPDGVVCFADGEAVSNLTRTDNGTVDLYAQWEPCDSSLVIDPNGGKFDGSTSVQTFPGITDSTFSVSASRVTPPAGVKATFVTNGGSACPVMTNTMRFTSWSSGPLYGTLGTNNVYTYPKKDGVIDRLTAVYDYNEITLPSTTWTNHSFSGWFYDAAFTKPAGGAGDRVTITRDTVFYAQWAELVLTSVDDYGIYGGAGGVDLSWTQKDSTQKVYKLWQSENGSTWTQLFSATSTGHDAVNVTSGKTSGSTYTVDVSGIYDITLSGAQGGGYGTHTGGKGGKVEMRVYLKKGDVVSYSVGGQDGSNGGGTGTMGAGGGYTAVGVNGSIVAIAGGGGGANTGYDGGSGGLETGTDTASNTGKNPDGGQGSGGGGGYGGGSAGTYIPEVRKWKIQGVELTPNTIYNIALDHPASPYHNGPANWNIRFTPKYKFDRESGELLATYNNDGISIGSYSWQYFIQDHFYINGIKYYCIDDGNTYYEADGLLQKSLWWTSIPDQYHADLLYCGKDNGGNDCPGSFGDLFPGITDIYGWHGVFSSYHCNGHLLFGNLEEYVAVPEQISQSYGGSSHVYDNSCIVSSALTASANTGDGSFSLKSVVLGFQDDMRLDDVKAYDKARPDRIATGTMTSSQSGSTVTFTWKEPASNGTTYFHKAESFQAGSNTVLCTSNITENTLTARITGYHYRLDTLSYGELYASDTKQAGRSMSVTVKDYDQWLHLAAVDAAGNIGPAVHVKVPGRLGQPDPDIPIRWNLHTDQITITGTDNNVHHSSGKTYYVRADSSTPFVLAGFGTMEGSPYPGYVLNGYGFVSDSGSRNAGTYLEVSGSSDGPASAGQWSNDITVLDPYMDFHASYSGGRTVLSGDSKFVMADGYDGRSVLVWPRAYVRYTEELHELMKWSDDAADRNNGLVLIGDARPPIIHGLEVLESIDIIDRSEGPVIADIWCEDSGSGVGGFTITITNNDTGAVQTIESNGEHVILNVTDDNSIFIGNFDVVVEAHDNVGNTSSAGANTHEFDMTAWITRILDPHDPLFREGESGILHVRTFGFADRIEVTFPEGLEAYSKVIDYENFREYEKNDEVQFMIPLYYMRDYFDGADHVDNVPLTVKAWKGDLELTAHPKMSVFTMEGTVLIEFRDRLR